MMPPIKALTHHKIATMLEEYNPLSVLDMGGVGRLGNFIDTKIVDANITNGCDCTKLGMPDKSFDATISIATIEHIAPDKQKLFIEQAIRLAKKITIHWFPMGPIAVKTDALKLKHGHKHESSIPSFEFVEHLCTKYGSSCAEPFMSIPEHLLLLASIRNNLNTKEIFDFSLKYRDKFYGCLWYCEL